MQKKLMAWLFSSVLLSVLITPCFAARGYEGYADLLTEAPWFDGAKSTIDYQDTTVGKIGTAAWVGIDNNSADGLKWIQGGWVKWKGQEPKIYWEYTDKNGDCARGYDEAPGASETYAQKKKADNVEWTHGDIVYKTVAWTKFDTVAFRKIQYGAEMLDPPDDHTPGKAASKNNFASSMGRPAGGVFAATGLAHKLDSAADGNVEKYGDANSGNLRTWDSRN